MKSAFTATLLITFLSLAGLIRSVSTAGQVVMDFNANASVSPSYMTPPWNEDGLRLNVFYTGSPSSLSSWYMFGPGSGRDTGHKAVGTAWTGTTNMLTAQSGATFTLLSMRLSPFTNGVAGTLTFIGTKANNTTVSQTFSTGTAIAGVVRNFSMDFQNVVSVHWINTSDGSTYSQWDDITAILQPGISVTPSLTVTESATSATVGVALSEVTTFPVNVTWTIAGGTAVQPGDFTLPGNAASGTLTIPPGQLAAQLVIPIVNDATSEPAEQFTVTFSGNTTGTVLTNNVSTVTIGNDDAVSNFAGWMSGHNLAGNNALPAADPNGDGISNIEAWLFRLNPAGASPAAWLARRPVYMVTGTNYPALRYTVPTPLPADVGITFEETATLAAWSPQATRNGFGGGSLWSGTGLSRVTETNAASGRTITMGGSLTVPSRPKVFLRLKYSLYSGVIDG